MTTLRLPAAPGPTWAWVLFAAVAAAILGYVRLVAYPDEFVPLAYGLPLVVFLWRRDLRILWGLSVVFLLFLGSKMLTLLQTDPGNAAEHMFFGGMQLLSVLVTSVAVHFVITLTRRLEGAAAELETAYSSVAQVNTQLSESNARLEVTNARLEQTNGELEATNEELATTNSELEAANEELAAREEEISHQNELLQRQATELEHQTEELTSQAEELQQVNEELLARERTLDEMIMLSAAGASEQEVFPSVGAMLSRLFTRGCAAAILTPHDDVVEVQALYGIIDKYVQLPRSSTLADIIASSNQAGFVADLSLRPDIAVPRLENGAVARSIIAAPAQIDGTRSMVLEVYSDVVGEWTDLELSLLDWVAEQCGRVWLTARLREDLAQLADSERAARVEAERSTRERDEFVATLAHELRTPLNAMLGWANLLRDIPYDSQRFEQGLEVIARNSNQQARLISDLLDVSRAARGMMELSTEPVDLWRTIGAAIEDVKLNADAKRIRISRHGGEQPTIVLGDPERLQQVVGNVLANAVKFTPADGSIELRLVRGAATAQIVVTDNGVGIDPAIIPHLFDRYKQADSSSSRSHGGLGLGLAIVKHLLELHGGSVELRSAGLGTGTTCTITLPVFAAAAKENGAGAPNQRHLPERSDSSLSGITVLLVEDDKDTREFVAQLLSEHGARVSSAPDALEALDRIEQIRPDVVVSDIGMPMVDGYEFIRRVRHHATAGLRQTPAIALTAFARAEDRKRALFSGFQMHLAKPIIGADLIAAVARVAARTSAATPELV